MAEIPESVRTVIESGRLAHLVTLGRGGNPQVSCVWVGIEDTEIVGGHLSIETDTVNEIGLTEYLVVYGSARITEAARLSCCRSSPIATSART